MRQRGKEEGISLREIMCHHEWSCLCATKSSLVLSKLRFRGKATCARSRIYSSIAL
jgi:hypothetical protein